MSQIGNVNVGVNFGKERNNLSQDTHTTAEIGYVQPTFCRYVVGKTHIDISAKSLVRLSAMAVPTMGRISLRHYFAYTDLATLWYPFEAFRTGNNYSYADGTTSIPIKVPYFSVFDLLNFAFDRSKILTSGIDQIQGIFYASVYKNGTLVDSTGLSSALTDIYTKVGTGDITAGIGWIPLLYKTHSTQRRRVTSINSSSGVVAVGSTGFPSYFDISAPVVTNQNADFSISTNVSSDKYMILCKFTTFGKRLRKQFIGAGYSFNPFDKQKVTLLKLFAIYKTWYDKFAVQRNLNFNNTACYTVLKYLSENHPIFRSAPDIFDPACYSTFVGDGVLGFLTDLADICYVLPPDYFSASDTTSYRGAVGNGGASYPNAIELDSPGRLDPGTGPVATDRIVADQLTGVGTNNTTFSSGNVSARGVAISLKFLRFVNKRSVVGRKTSELLKLEGESDQHQMAHEQVHHLGASRIDVQISDIMSTADTASASLGDFAGRGIGYKDGEHFVYDTPSYGVMLCLTAVVPTSGYFQGILKENTDIERFDFFTEDFDAAGYQSIAMNELIADLQFDNSNHTSPVGTDLGYFGLVPRYQHLKVGRNICNGDMSVPSMQPVMLPYNIDRHFITCAPNTSNVYDFNDVNIPTVYPETFREVRADTGYGDYNRIFQYVGNDYDHFIVHIVFDCPILSPQKSVANSYDTFQEDDNTALEFKHE